MKGAQGLIVAALLGAFAVVLNWLYLVNKTKTAETVNFIGIRTGATIKVGDTLGKDNLGPVPIPRSSADRLQGFVYKYEVVDTVAGYKATRNYKGGDLVYREDFRTPSHGLKAGEDESIVPIPVDSRTFNPSLIDPGDMVRFIVPKPPEAKSAAKTTGGNGGRVDPADGPAAMEAIGPFRVYAVGDRISSLRVARAFGQRQGQGRQISIFLKVDKNGQPVGESKRLIERAHQIGFRNVSVMKMPEKKE